MKAVDLLKLLKAVDPETVILVRAYTGGETAVFDAEFSPVNVGNKVPHFDGTQTKVVKRDGTCCNNVLIIEPKGLKY